MSGGRDCQPCEWEREGLLRLFAIKDVIDLVLWGEYENPQRGVETAIQGLLKVRQAFAAAGYEWGQG